MLLHYTVSRPFAQQPIYRFAPPFWEIFPLAAGGETPPLRPYKFQFVVLLRKPEKHNILYLEKAQAGGRLCFCLEIHQEAPV